MKRMAMFHHHHRVNDCEIKYLKKINTMSILWSVKPFKGVGA